MLKNIVFGVIIALFFYMLILMLNPTRPTYNGTSLNFFRDGYPTMSAEDVEKVTTLLQD